MTRKEQPQRPQPSDEEMRQVVYEFAVLQWVANYLRVMRAQAADDPLLYGPTPHNFTQPL